jgi:hypothetical protein
MSENSHRSVTAPIVAFLLLPVLYVASIGPACYLVHCGSIEPATVNTIYRPVLICPLPESASGALIAYCAAWSDEQTLFNITFGAP